MIKNALAIIGAIVIAVAVLLVAVDVASKHGWNPFR